MENTNSKLQELTDRLYKEGLAKGREEAQELKSRAEKEASETLEKARAEAQRLIDDARRKADEITSKATSDLRSASVQTVSALQRKVEDMILAKAVTAPVKETFSDIEFMKEIIKAVASAFNASDPDAKGLEIILPETLKDRMQDFISQKSISALAGGLNASYVKGMKDGFRIGPADGGWKISFTSEDFSGIIGEYLRPLSRKIIFG